MAKVDVSVITNCYREPLEYLKRNMEALAEQKTRYTFQHIVFADGVDDTGANYLPVVVEAAKKYKHDAIYSASKKNLGLAGARNRALELAEGQYVLFSDCDDLILEGALDKHVDKMVRDGLDHCYGGAVLFGDRREVIYGEEDYMGCYARGINPCFANCVRKTVFDVIGGFDEKMKKGAEDLEMWVRIAKGGFKVGHLKETLHALCIHSTNMSKWCDFVSAYKYIQKKHGIFTPAVIEFMEKEKRVPKYFEIRFA